ncbi:phosphoribosylglycinamide formyltransferase [Burkholderia cenocepacia]|uniref:Phosphoribosylglycinamide formyltransferase n=1 Tax=Burkholderia cenocepacia (strain ATCC BAA-245 / DSM 16553 / LMG 16656 / NCTC 13227 / J2315 / CF5610) TaxID=216591 RepID=B4E8Z5_BURCJ|nr:phosphoribosylglycinamide formyltransferase [Burkholderia cenocepacia]KIS47328.1 phosphoribosylglycinamide formyltransferase [Burkholderia cepacia]EPZ86023.1 phosphoribosylglycinamide formyltransferase [Burkholderia cenocepacia K56-2Valvano]ERI30503.1 phosphoribosylglycinamide formyltransferase [Burkholderia cenocepacia BC7]KKI78249.1 phosphoribosylglycinamide formyltransferase [Burkholderia cenocepacia]ONX60674.1 phosphoribosylglycinamide formyltransferase [Burkholderia cenocepacia]
MKKLVILISGRGSNMEAIVRACAQERWPAEIAAVIANRPDAAGLAFAASHGVATAVVDHRSFDGRDSFDAALAAEIDRFSPDLVVLAGFMRILTPAFVRRYEGRLLNIHPSLLPSFKGIHTHQQALDAGVALHGASVHFVIPELDSGAIVAQGAVPVCAGDDAAALAQRVLAVEHVLYPRAVRWFVDGRLRLENGRAVVAPEEARWIFADQPQTETSEGV